MVSVVIPARDSGKYIGELISSLLRQTRPPEEIVVVDAGSTDNTVEVARSASVGFDGMKIVNAGPAFPGRARNLGAEASAGDIVAMTDSDTVPDPAWLELLLKALGAAPDAGLALGSYRVNPENAAQRCMAFSITSRRKEVGGLRVCTDSFASVAFRREAWEKTGGFPEKIRAGEDLLLMSKVRGLGIGIVYAPEAVVLWRLPKDLMTMLRREALYSGARTFGGYSSVYPAKLTAFYLATAAAAAVLPLALIAAAAVFLLRIRKLVQAVDEATRAYLASPMDYVRLSVFVILDDLAHIAGWLSGLVRKAVERCPDAG